MKKTKFLNTMSFKISSRIAVIITVMLAVICITIGFTLTKTVTTMTEDKITLLADKNARIANDYLNTLGQKASMLSTTIMSYSGLLENNAKNLTKDIFTDTLKDERIFGVYVAVEPNKFYSNTPDGYSFYAYRSEAGDIVYENYGYADYKDGEFYTAAKESLHAEITEPYSWTLTNGDVVWLITISVPMLDHEGHFVGVMNCDVAVDTIISLTYDNGGYEKAYSYILTENGNYVVHSTDETKFGTPYSEAGEAETVLDATRNGKEVFFEDINQVYGGQAFKVHVPLKINGVSEPWSSAFVVDKAEAMQMVMDNLLLLILISLGGIILLVLLTSLFIRQSISPIKSLVATAADLEKGHLSSSVQIKSKDELGNLSSIFNTTIATLNGYVSEISTLLNDISAGKLTGTVKRDYEGDFAPIRRSLLSIIDSLNETFVNINTVAREVSDGAAQVSSGAQTLATGATEQASTIEQLSAAITSVSEDVKKNADNISLASDYIGQAGSQVQKSNESMAALLTSMETINTASEKISAIMKIIDDISFQTNILALNAAVEAARAGQAGKGFSVVAEEVRRLASKSAEAAKQTAELINNSILAIKDGQRHAASTSEALKLVSEKAQLVEETNAIIRAASSSQTQSIHELELGIHQFSAVTQTISATAEENAAASEELSSQAALLFNEARKFQTKNSSAAPAITEHQPVRLSLTD